MIPSVARKAVNGGGGKADEENAKKSFGSVPLLDMLAEVASATLKSDPVLLKDAPQKVRKATLQADVLTLDQIRILSDRMLLDTFSELTSNEMRRTFSYRCFLMPNICSETFSSFGNENRARLQMKNHLLAHIAKLLTDSNAAGRQGRPPFTAEPIQARRKRLQETEGGGRRRKRSQVKKVSQSGGKADWRRTSLPPSPGKGKVQSKVHKCKPHTKLQVKVASKPEQKTASRAPPKPASKPKASRLTRALEGLVVVKEEPPPCNGELHPASQAALQDHSYWGVPGRPAPLVDDSCDSEMEEWCGDRVERPPSCQSVIATPPFPYVYVPLLPNTSAVVEVSTPAKVQQVQESPASEEEEEEEEEDEEEDEEEEEEEEPKQPARAKPQAGRRSSGTTAEADFERRLALKHIRALRSKRKDERGPLVCKICKTKVFTAQATLMYHYRSHAGIKPFNCKICEATFTRQHSLNYHMLIHNNKSRFACEDCGRHFRHPSHFKEHLRRHTGETPYQCTDCSQRSLLEAL